VEQCWLDSGRVLPESPVSLTSVNIHGFSAGAPALITPARPTFGASTPWRDLASTLMGSLAARVHCFPHRVGCGLSSMVTRSDWATENKKPASNQNAGHFQSWSGEVKVRQFSYHVVLNY